MSARGLDLVGPVLNQQAQLNYGGVQNQNPQLPRGEPARRGIPLPTPESINPQIQRVTETNTEQIEKIREEVVKKITERKDILSIIKKLNEYFRTLDECYTIRYDPKADRNYVEVLDIRGNQIKTIPPTDLLKIIARVRRILMAGGSLKEANGVLLDVLR